MERSSSKEYGFHLLTQLESILKRDPLIDEVGFVHPSQFLSLNEDPQSACGELGGGILSTEILEDNVIEYDESVFWNRYHKLAISTEALLTLYKAAKEAFIGAMNQYKKAKDLQYSSDMENFLANEVMMHSRAVLLLSCDFYTAWNSRKLVLSRKQTFSLEDELQLSAVILSYSHKSEHVWSHRRWVIKMIAEKNQNIMDIVKRESRLVENIAKKSKMNFRAWNHRCWLVFYMTKELVLYELNHSRKWAESHVADNCCFQYRRKLMLRVLADVDTLEDKSKTYELWKEELEWTDGLIKLYIGREALWMHRRFLVKSWFNYYVQESPHGIFELDTFFRKDLEFIRFCLRVSNEFHDDLLNRELAASYILWTSKQTPQFYKNRIKEQLKELGALKNLMKVSPEKTWLWQDFLENMDGT